MLAWILAAALSLPADRKETDDPLFLPNDQSQQDVATQAQSAAAPIQPADQGLALRRRTATKSPSGCEMCWCRCGQQDCHTQYSAAEQPPAAGDACSAAETQPRCLAALCKDAQADEEVGGSEAAAAAEKRNALIGEWSRESITSIK